MKQQYANPFDRYSSRTKRLNYYLPFLRERRFTNKQNIHEAFIGREDILYRLRNWITNKDKTGSFLVAGYRGMGKSSFVEKALYDITRQRRRSSKIEFIFFILHLITIALFCSLFIIKPIDNIHYLFIGLAALAMLSIFCYVKKYHIKYCWGYFCLYCGLVKHIIQHGEWRKNSTSDIGKSIKECIAECCGRLRKIDKEERSRLNKIIFKDYRRKTAQRIAIQINLGHEILTERDILCLIAKRIKAEVENFVSNKHLYFLPAYFYILVCCFATLGIMKQLNGPIKEVVQKIYEQQISPSSSTSEVHIANASDMAAKGEVSFIHLQENSKPGFFQTLTSYLKTFFIQLKETSNGYIILFKIICFVLIYLCIRKLLRITFLFIPGIKQYVWIRKQLNTLNDRIHTVIDEETPPLAEGSQGFINITFGKRRKKNYPIAEVREIESELIDILSHFDRIINAYTLKFVIVFDELDKIDPEMSNKEPEDELFATFEGTANGFSGDSSSRKRKDNVLRLLANMKHFISTARAKFIFISGRELYDAYLAGLSDREFAISSVFSGAIYVDSFLTSNRTQMNVISMTEQYLCKMLLPKKYLRNKMKEKYYRYGISTPEYPSLKWYYRYLRELEKDNPSSSAAEEWRLKGGIVFLHYFSIYLTHISNGSPQKILSYFRMYVRTEDNLYRKGNKSPYIYGWKTRDKRKHPSKNYVLTFNYVNQRKIAFIFYMAYPIMQAIINNASQYGDKLLISASFLMNHIYKYHSYSFSWRNLEQAPELLEVYRTPELRTFIHTILSYMVHTHMTNIPSGLYNFKFRKSVASEIAIFSKYSEEIAAIFNFTLDESLSVKKHFTRMLVHYSNMLKQTNSNYEHYAIILSRIHQVLGDLQMTDENYLDSALEYRNSIAYLKDLLHQKEASEQMASGDIILPLIRNMLKLGLTYEHRKTNNSAYVIYYELICMLIDFRYVDEAKLGLKLRVEKSQDWRDKKYVLYKEHETGTPKGIDPNYFATKQDEIEEKKNFEKEIETQLLPTREHLTDQYEMQGDELVTGLSRILTPEKSNLIFRLSLLEDLRLVYQAILAKLFVLEKVELGGITKANVDVAESEFRYLYRVTNAKDKFIILVDFFRRLAEILYYKNGLINRNSDRFVTGLYFWGYEFDTDIEEFCRDNGLNIKTQQSIERVINRILWSDLGNDIAGWKDVDYTEQWDRIKKRLIDIVDKMKLDDEPLKSYKEDTKKFLKNWNIEKSYVKNLSYFKVDKCNRHRKEMLQKGCSVPCFSCRYYNRSMHILLEYFFGEKVNIEDKVSKVRAFLKKANWSPQTYSLRPNYLQTIAITLDGMGNVLLSCSGKDSELTEDFLKQLAELSDSNKEFERMEELTSLEKAILYYWAAARYYKRGSFLKDASISMKKILCLLNRYIMVEKMLPSHTDHRIPVLSEYLCKIIDVVTRKATLYLYAHNENISIAEIQDLKGLFSLKPYEDISLEKLSLYPDLEEIIMLSTELKLYIYRHFKYRPSLMPKDFSKAETLNILKLYSYRLSSAYNIERTVQQLIVESRMKAIWNYMFIDYLFDGIDLMEYHVAKGQRKIRYRTDTPIVFYKKFARFLKEPLKKNKLELFGMNLEECGMTEDYLTVKDKLQLIEFLLKDSMFCLQRILSVLTTNTNQLLHTNSYIAEIYRMMFAWTQIFKFLYFAYEYMDAEEAVQNKILIALNSFITSRHISMEEPLTDMEERRNMQTIKKVLELCVCEIGIEGLEPDFGTLGTEFYNHILSVIEPTNLRYIISNYPAEMALMYYRKTTEMHTEGNAYKEMVAGLYYLDDDLQNDTEQFYMALERYLINCGYIDCMSKAIKDIYSKAYIYTAECYENGDPNIPRPEYQNVDPIWGMNI